MEDRLEQGATLWGAPMWIWNANGAPDDGISL